MKLPSSFHLFGKKTQEFLLACQPVDGMVPEKSTKGGCSPESHMFVSDGGSVEDNLDAICLCGAKTLREIFGG